MKNCIFLDTKTAENQPNLIFSKFQKDGHHYRILGQAHARYKRCCNRFLKLKVVWVDGQRDRWMVETDSNSPPGDQVQVGIKSDGGI